MVVCVHVAVVVAQEAEEGEKDLVVEDTQRHAGVDLHNHEYRSMYKHVHAQIRSEHEKLHMFTVHPRTHTYMREPLAEDKHADKHTNTHTHTHAHTHTHTHTHTQTRTFSVANAYGL